MRLLLIILVALLKPSTSKSEVWCLKSESYTFTRAGRESFTLSTRGLSSRLGVFPHMETHMRQTWRPKSYSLLFFVVVPCPCAASMVVVGGSAVALHC